MSSRTDPEQVLLAVINNWPKKEKDEAKFLHKFGHLLSDKFNRSILALDIDSSNPQLSKPLITGGGRIAKMFAGVPDAWLAVLRQYDAGWQLEIFTFQCTNCFGLGMSGPEVCNVCGGAGWGILDTVEFCVGEEEFEKEAKMSSRTNPEQVLLAVINNWPKKKKHRNKFLREFGHLLSDKFDTSVLAVSIDPSNPQLSKPLLTGGGRIAKFIAGVPDAWLAVLEQHDGAWQLAIFAYQCPSCFGLGMSGVEVCGVCGGTGWGDVDTIEFCVGERIEKEARMSLRTDPEQVLLAVINNWPKKEKHRDKFLREFGHLLSDKFDKSVLAVPIDPSNPQLSKPLLTGGGRIAKMFADVNGPWLAILKRYDEEWRLEMFLPECTNCFGLGMSGVEVCDVCGGQGWGWVDEVEFCVGERTSNE